MLEPSRTIARSSVIPASASASAMTMTMPNHLTPDNYLQYRRNGPLLLRGQTTRHCLFAALPLSVSKPRVMVRRLERRVVRDHAGRAPPLDRVPAHTDGLGAGLGRGPGRPRVVPREGVERRVAVAHDCQPEGLEAVVCFAKSFGSVDGEAWGWETKGMVKWSDCSIVVAFRERQRTQVAFKPCLLARGGVRVVSVSEQVKAEIAL